MVKVALQDFDELEIFEAVDGHKAVKLAGRVQPDLILLDNRMPTMSGEAVAKKLQTDPLTNSISIVMITSMRLTKKQIELIKLDVDDYVEKPITPWQIKKFAKRYLPGLNEGMDMLDVDGLFDD